MKILAVSATRLVVVGGGILGTMHAWEGTSRGWDVLQIERDDVPRGASLRNFGLIWVSGRAGGHELSLALHARERWEEIGARCPRVGFRANGSLTVARSPGEVAVLEEATRRPDSAARGLTLLEPTAARALNASLRGPMLAALHCATDAVVEPRDVLGALRDGCAHTGRYRWLPGREVVGLSDHEVIDSFGERHRGDLVVLCTGASHRGLAGEALQGAPLRRVRLQMLETERFRERVTTSVADGDSLRYYPVFAGTARARLPPQPELAAAWEAQLLLVQRLHGGLTIGDTHSSDEPFPFDVDEAPYRHLTAVARAVLGDELPPVRRRWAGVYSQLTTVADASPYLRLEVARGVEVVTGVGGRGMTLAPAVAQETFG